jgi:hypothetical protein
MLEEYVTDVTRDVLGFTTAQEHPPDVPSAPFGWCRQGRHERFLLEVPFEIGSHVPLVFLR